MKPQTSEYRFIHKWIIKKKGMAIFCSFNKEHKGKRFEWALKKGCKYEKDLNNFFQLCPSCHRKYDYTERQRKFRKFYMKDKKYNIKSIKQFNLNGSFIKEFSSAVEVWKELGILRSSIVNMLKGRSKTSGGYIWKYKYES